MEYRRFGRTELPMPVVSCGGMRFQHGWGEVDPKDISPEGQANLEACVHRALELGITHIETARGYGSSEYQLGRILPTLPRQKLIVQTKVGIAETPRQFLEQFETSMANLRLEYVDLLALHGLNDRECLERTMSGGILEAARQLQKEGRARYIGFSSHAWNDLLVEVVNSGEFDYLNLHYFYVDQRNLPTIEAATAQDMGVFIISPTDKGGLLQKPSPILSNLCQPLHPITFNGLWCLSDPRIHTLSCGVAKPSEFDELCAAVELLPEACTHLGPILERLEAQLESALGREWLRNWHVNLPAWDQTPGGVELYQTLRLYNLYKAFGMLEHGKARYNLLGNGGHWFPGQQVDRMTDWQQLEQCIRNSPVAGRIPGVLREAHEAFKADEQKRLSQS